MTPQEKKIKIEKGLNFFKENLEEILDKNFPKGECAERGRALVMFADILIFLRQVLKL